MPNPIPDSEIDEATAIMVAGSMLWYEILHSGMIEEDGGPDEVDIEACRDIWARCQEAGIKPPHIGVVTFVAHLMRESVMPDEDWDKCIDAALTFISFLAVEKL